MEGQVPSFNINPQISSDLDLQRKKSSCQAHEKVCAAAIADLRSLATDAKSMIEELEVLALFFNSEENLRERYRATDKVPFSACLGSFTLLATGRRCEASLLRSSLEGPLRIQA